VGNDADFPSGIKVLREKGGKGDEVGGGSQGLRKNYASRITPALLSPSPGPMTMAY